MVVLMKRLSSTELVDTLPTNGAKRESITRFVVHYCHNCDGGTQEFLTVARIIREVFPKAQILGRRKKAFPIEVTVMAHLESSREVIMYHGQQQSLFRKYPGRRDGSIKQLKASLLQLSEVC